MFCDAPIDPARDYQKVEGFERRRAGGGTNAIRLRHPLPAWACVGCVVSQAAGISTDQQQMI